MATKSSKIRAADYNAFYSPLNTVLGTGSGGTGYGQTLTMSPTSVATLNKIRQVHWANIKTDVLKLANHQGLLQNPSWTSGTLTSIPTLPTITTTTKVSATDISALQNALTVVTNSSNIYNIAAGQYSDEALLTSTRSTQWNVEIDHFFTLDFGSSDNARYFFNAGGIINITPNFAQSSSTLINNDWASVINVGTFSFGYKNFTLGGSQVSSIGFYSLTNAEQQVYIRSGGKVSGASMYSTNDMKITVYSDVSSNTNGGARYVYIKLYLQDNKTSLNPPFGIDEYVTGTVTNTVRMYRPSGTNVNVSAPTPITTTDLTAGT